MWVPEGRNALYTAVDFKPDVLAAQLAVALGSGGPLPPPPRANPEASLGRFGSAEGRMQAVLEQLPEEEEGRQRLPPPLPLRQRQAEAAVRTAAAAVAADPPAALPAGASSAGGGDLPDLSGSAAALRGRHAAAAGTLATWVADFLAASYASRRALLEWWYRQPGNTVGGATRAAARSAVDVVEKDALLARLDSMWQDFLAVSCCGIRQLAGCWLLPFIGAGQQGGGQCKGAAVSTACRRPCLKPPDVCDGSTWTCRTLSARGA